MRLALASLVVSMVAACSGGDSGSGVSATVPDGNPQIGSPTSSSDPVSALASVRTGRCVTCHAFEGAAASVVAPLARIPLRNGAPLRAGDSLREFLRTHHAAEDADAIAMWMRGSEPMALRAASVATDAPARGERLFGELGCAACHMESAMASLAERADHEGLVAFLREPSARRPDLAHDFALSAEEASDLAAHLLRAQAVGLDDAPAQGLEWECFEIDIDGDKLPVLDGVVPTAKGATDRVDVSVRTREDRFALRFTGLLLVPQSGEWTFTLGSDDSSWLWVDDELVVANAKVAPHSKKSGTVRLEAGAHRMRIVFTELGGQQSLEFLWRGPSTESSPVPSSALARKAVNLVPRANPPFAIDAALLARGEAAFAAGNCAACHERDGAALPRPATPWAQLRGGRCAVAADGEAVFAAAREALRAEPSAAVALDVSLQALRCVSCHARDGRGGMDAAARARLVEVEDIGDEGRVPPDLSRAGHRLRSEWLRSVLTGEHRIRGYMKARMPRLSAGQATELAAAFERADAKPGDDIEPAFDSKLVQRGQELVGVAGRNCVTCHPFGGRRAIGPQGMDLALQHARLKPAWFADWLLHATALRPGTRMPSFWLRDDAASREDVAAIRLWSSLGSAAPIPKGYASAGRGLELDPVDRPILHGAFLKGLSARCVAVGTPSRGHYAFDVENAQLAWLWRGEFLDAAGTWSGRAGQLLSPLSEDRVVLDVLPIREVDGPAENKPESIGQRRMADGNPSFRVRVGKAVYEDSVAPELTQRGIEFVRTIRCEQGVLRIEAAARSGGARVTIEGAPADLREVKAGESLELRYAW